MPIKRYFSDECFQRIENDFGFLSGILKGFYGEIELSFRENYFNLYYRGNSVAKVKLKKDGHYDITIHKKFCSKSIEDDRRFSAIPAKEYKIFNVQSNLLRSFFQKRNLDGILANIKDENYSEELAFEQILITDNFDRKDIIVIDRQITDAKLDRKRMDILALKQVQENNYSFLVLEVKMGNNPELKANVAEQISSYMRHVQDNFPEYKYCYEKQYEQKKRLGLISTPQWQQIIIVPEVGGLVVVGVYSGVAREQISELKKAYPNLKVWQSQMLLPSE